MQNNTGYVLSNNELAIASEQELYDRYTQLVNDISRYSNTNKRHQLEIELCYVQRELQLRDSRNAAHAEYLNKINSVYEDESQYPQMDELVNYEFVVLSRQLVRFN